MNFELQERNTANETKNGCMQILLPDVVAPEVHQNYCNYFCEQSEPTLARYARTLHGEQLHGGPLKTQKCQNLGMGACMGMGACPRQYGLRTGQVAMITLWYSNYIDLLWCQLKHVCHVFFRCYAGKLALLESFFQVV